MVLRVDDWLLWTPPRQWGAHTPRLRPSEVRTYLVPVGYRTPSAWPCSRGRK